MKSTDIKRRAQQLSNKTNIDTIPPTEVGGIMYDTVEYMESVERNGGNLGIRKTYKTVNAMETDKNPVDDKDGSPLRRGMLVNIYDQENEQSADNGKVFSWQKPGWAFRTKVDAGYVPRWEFDEKIEDLESHIDRIFDCGRADTKYGGARTINCGGANI